MVLLFAESLGRSEALATVLRSVVTAPLRHEGRRAGTLEDDCMCVLRKTV